MEHPVSSLEQKLWAIKAWSDLAGTEERAIELGIALCPQVNRNNAELYRKTALAIQHEIDTGEALCTCCWKPFGGGARIPGLASYRAE